MTKEGAVVKRLRYNVADEQWNLIQEGAKILGVEPKLLLQLSTSIGLRFLDFSIIHPINVGIAKAIDEQSTGAATAMLGEFSRLMAGEGQAPTANLPAVAVEEEPKQKPRTKKPIRKTK